MCQHYFWAELRSQRGWLGVDTKLTNENLHTAKQVNIGQTP